jgi:tRNA(fMet)-specific endonuclease VapC
VTDLLLDTSAYSSFLAGHPEVGAAVRQAGRVVLTPVVLGELLAGFRRGRQRARNEGHLQSFLAAPRVEVVPVDDETAVRYAVILDALRAAGTPIPTNDIWISASAMQHGLAILTTDAHFRKVAQVITLYPAPLS